MSAGKKPKGRRTAAALPRIAPGPLRNFRGAVLRWYGKHGRDLPWRGEHDSYPVLISEIMLQQTQVPRVLVKLPEFLALFPTMTHLAGAEQRDVVTAWRGMGYNNRAVRLHRLAKIVVEQHGGHLPDDLETLRMLPGIGRYTAHALLAFAHRRSVPLVDVNIRRLLSRLFWRMPDTATVRGEEEVWRLATMLVPANRSYDWNQALMDLGAVICVARTPRCGACPVAAVCRSRARMKPHGRTAAKPEPGRHGTPNRVYRGRIVEILRGRPRPMTTYALGRLICQDFSEKDHSWLENIVNGLIRDGIITARRHPRAGLRLSLA